MMIVLKTRERQAQLKLVRGRSLIFGGVLALLGWASGPAFGQSAAVKSGGAELLGFGSRAGMDVTVTRREGIGTAHATIAGRLTRDNARRYCADYEQNNSERCIDSYLQDTKLEDAISADCERGMFTTFYGDRYRFVGKNPDPDGVPEYVVISLKDDRVLNGSSASGLSETLGQFQALCPNRFASSDPSITPPTQRSQVKGRPVTARGLGAVPGALICPDHETLTTVFQLQGVHWEEAMQDRLTNGTSRLLRGPAIQAPEPSDFDCALLPAGTPMILVRQTPLPVVSAKLANGETVTGVTLTGMIAAR